MKNSLIFSLFVLSLSLFQCTSNSSDPCACSCGKGFVCENSVCVLDVDVDVIEDLEPEDGTDSDPAGLDQTTDEQPEQTGGPCIQVEPWQLDFGYKALGMLETQVVSVGACGSEALEIYGIYLTQDSADSFTLGLSTLDHEPTPEHPLLVLPGHEITFEVGFLRLTASAEDPQGNPVLDVGTVVIDNNSPENPAKIALGAVAVVPTCPTAVIHCAQGDEVTPQTTLHLKGDESYASYLDITKWVWSVKQPSGSQSVFVPSPQIDNPTFLVGVAGVYTFLLDVFDETGLRSCVPAEYEVLVIPHQAIHVELVWHTPNDIDETDSGPEAGANLDLHLAHPWASGPDLDMDGVPDGWFDNLFDCFWFNAHPNWGSFDPGIQDDPILSGDDDDGAGPEMIDLNIPEEGVTYRVGVHYWNDNGYGMSYATVRVYIYSYLVFEQANVMLADKDMWEVCTIEWPSGKVLVVETDGSYKITHDYDNPYFFQDQAAEP